MKAAYIYVYCNEEGVPFYVGKGGENLPSNGAKQIFALEMKSPIDALDYKDWLIDYFTKQGISLQNKSANKKHIPAESYVYIHSTPDDVPFYIGAGTGWHAYNFSAIRTIEYREVISKYGRDAIKVSLITCKNKFFASELKQQMISDYLSQGHPLVNVMNKATMDADEGEFAKDIEHLENADKLSKF